MTRQVPQALYDEVMDLATAIAQPEAEYDIDEEAADAALAKLVALFRSREAAGLSDPFLTETLADFTDDLGDSIDLYRLALEQCAAFPDEPTHTKRQSLAECLLEDGSIAEAREELDKAIREAFAAGDTDAISELNELLAELGK